MRTKSATNLISRVDQNRPGGNSNLIKAVKLTHRVLTIDLIYIAWINWLNKQVGTFDQGQWSHSGYWTNRGVQIRLSEWKLLMYNDHWWVQSVMAVSQFYSVSKSGDEVSNRMEGGPPGVTRHYLVRASFWKVTIKLSIQQKIRESESHKGRGEIERVIWDLHDIL